jgi:hypothetical protein
MSDVCVQCGASLTPRQQARRQKFCSARCVYAYRLSGVCVDCGGPCTRTATRCGRCARRVEPPRHETIRELRAQGLLNTEIAAVLGCSVHAVAQTVSNMRKRGIAVAPTTYYTKAAGTDSE